MTYPYGEPQSRNEAILQNILGANNVILPPFSRIEELLIDIAELIAGGGGGSLPSGTNDGDVLYWDDGAWAVGAITNVITDGDEVSY